MTSLSQPINYLNVVKYYPKSKQLPWHTEIIITYFISIEN